MTDSNHYALYMARRHHREWATRRKKMILATAGFALSGVISVNLIQQAGQTARERWDAITPADIAPVRNDFSLACSVEVNKENFHPRVIARGIEGCMDYKAKRYLTENNPFDKMLYGLTLLFVYSLPLMGAGIIAGGYRTALATRRIYDETQIIKTLEREIKTYALDP